MPYLDLLLKGLVYWFSNQSLSPSHDILDWAMFLTLFMKKENSPD